LEEPGTGCPHCGLSTTLYLAVPPTSRTRRDPCVRRSLVTFVSTQLLFARFDNIVHFTRFVSSHRGPCQRCLPRPIHSLRSWTLLTVAFQDRRCCSCSLPLSLYLSFRLWIPGLGSSVYFANPRLIVPRTVNICSVHVLFDRLSDRTIPLFNLETLLCIHGDKKQSLLSHIVKIASSTTTRVA
jgi:hypothetical protein